MIQLWVPFSIQHRNCIMGILQLLHIHPISHPDGKPETLAKNSVMTIGLFLFYVCQWRRGFTTLNKPLCEGIAYLKNRQPIS